MKNNYLYELLKENEKKLITFGGQLDVNAIVKLLEENACCSLPCKVEDTVYKLCPRSEGCGYCPEDLEKCKCEACYAGGCAYGIFTDANQLATIPTMAIVEVTVTNGNIYEVLKYWNTLYFKTVPDAEEGKQSYYAALEGKTNEERFANYEKWLEGRGLRFSELMNHTTPDEEFERYLAMSYSRICYAVDCDDSFKQEFELVLQCNGINGILETLVYKHLSTGRYLCLTNREPYNTTGKVCEVVLFQSVDLSNYKTDAPYLLCDLIDTLTSMLFVHYYCGGIVETAEKKEALWFREKKIIGGEQNG